MKTLAIFVTVMLFAFSLISKGWCAEDAAAARKAVQKISEELAAEAESEQEEPVELERIDLIEVWVRSCEIHVYQNMDDDMQIEQVFPAATATWKKEKELPFGKIGRVRKIVFNPPWKPTKNIRKELQAKHPEKNIPKIYPPGKNNPLGIGKIYFTYLGGPNDLGIHDTDNQGSIGKRASHGCTRMHSEEFLDLATIILKQNGFETEKIIARARENRNKTSTYAIADGPTVVYLKK
jgi:hypothetical protein